MLQSSAPVESDSHDTARFGASKANARSTMLHLEGLETESSCLCFRATDDGTWTTEIQPTFAPTIDYLAAKKPVANCIPGKLALRKRTCLPCLKTTKQDH